MIGEQTAEEIKITIGTAFEKPEPKAMEVKGRDLVTGLPKTIRVTSEDTRDALKEVTGQIVDAVHSVLERTPPELAADVVDRGIVLTGGGALLSGLEELIEAADGHQYDDGRGSDDCSGSRYRKICRADGYKWENDGKELRREWKK